MQDQTPAVQIEQHADAFDAFEEALRAAGLNDEEIADILGKTHDTMKARMAAPSAMSDESGNHVPPGTGG